MTYNNELEVLKSQMEVLKRVLSHDEIVSEDMFRAAIEARTKGLDYKKSEYLRGLVMTCIVGAFLAQQFAKGMFSMPFMAITTAWIILFIVLNIIGYLKNDHDNLMCGTLVGTAENIMSWRRKKSVEGIVKTIATAIWAPACLIEIWGDVSTNPVHAMLAALIFAFVLYSAIRTHVRGMRSSKEILDQIAEISR